MCPHFSYSKQFMLHIKDRTVDLPLNVPVNNHTDVKKHYLRKRRRAGWQKALNRTMPRNMTVPSIMCNNVRSIFNKIPDLTYLLQSRVFRNSCVICLQESWLNVDIDDSLVNIDKFECYRQDRVRSRKKTGGGVLTYLNSDWCGKSQNS